MFEEYKPKEKELPPAVTCKAVCIWMVDYGTTEKEFKGRPKTKQRDIRFFFEISKRMKDGRRFIIPTTRFHYTLGQGANLKKFVESWIGKNLTKAEIKGFNFLDLPNKSCQISISHSEDGEWANISSIMPLSEDQEPLQPENEVIVFDLDCPNYENLEKLPNWVQTDIWKSDEFKKLSDEEIKPEGPIVNTKETENGNGLTTEPNGDKSTFDDVDF